MKKYCELLIAHSYWQLSFGIGNISGLWVSARYKPWYCTASTVLVHVMLLWIAGLLGYVALVRHLMLLYKFKRFCSHECVLMWTLSSRTVTVDWWLLINIIMWRAQIHIFAVFVVSLVCVNKLAHARAPLDAVTWSLPLRTPASICVHAYMVLFWSAPSQAVLNAWAVILISYTFEE